MWENRSRENRSPDHYNIYARLCSDLGSAEHLQACTAALNDELRTRCASSTQFARVLAVSLFTRFYQEAQQHCQELFPELLLIRSSAITTSTTTIDHSLISTREPDDIQSLQLFSVRYFNNSHIVVSSKC